MLGVGDRRGAQDHGVDESEDRGFRADAEPQRQNRRREKPWLAPQHPYSNGTATAGSVPLGETLPSQHYSFGLVRDAIRQQKKIVMMRSERV
jgi:hypothetical protein